ncbi:MAG: Extracellular lipase, Pla/cef family [Steroidobacteraceae bacterium]|jgi:dienelactone hydrolase|nr:Extracellular lipase, Pla/cef family [Steroidobacteraceae bacterium]
MKRLLAATILAAIVTAGCSSSVDNSDDVRPTDPTAGNGNPSGATPPAGTAPTAARFQPAQGVFPFPNDLYFSGTTDGTLNIQPANGLIPQQAGLNALDGWSTTAPIRVTFGGPLNPASIGAATVRMYQVTVSNTNKAVSGFTRVLTYGTDYTAGVATDAGVGPTILEIRPLVPLQPSSGPLLPTDPLPPGTGYVVVLTNGLTMASGASATADRDYATIKTTLGPTVNPANCATLPNAPMQGACGFTASHFAVAANPALGAAAVNPANAIVSFHFSTQATRDTMRVLGQIITLVAPPPAIVVSPTPIPLPTFNAQFPNNSTVRLGTVTVPYYSYIPTGANDANVLRRAWTAAAAPPAPLTDPNNERNLTRFNPVPALVANKPIPLVVTVPNGAKPANGWPAVIFQHGITGDRSNALAIAGAFAQAGWAVAAVDLPLHGVVNTAAAPLYQATNEQTFNLDLVNNTTGAAGPDGNIDSSGTHYINLSFPLASRDNQRQAAVNMLALRRALPTLDLDGVAGGDIDNTRIAFVGMSLGSITGIIYGASLPAPALSPTMAFAVPGGGLAELLRDSVQFGPRINAGLQAQGLLPGTSLYNQFMRDVQAIVDAGDSLNYVTAAANGRAIYFSQMVGGTPPPPNPDQVIPNSATQRLITALQAAGVDFRRVPPGPWVGSGYVNFVAGDHGTLLSPAASLAATAEMQTEVVTFTASGNPPVPGPAPSPTILVTNGAVVQP